MMQRVSEALGKQKVEGTPEKAKIGYRDFMTNLSS
jgi:hypothetical protein